MTESRTESCVLTRKWKDRNLIIGQIRGSEVFIDAKIAGFRPSFAFVDIQSKVEDFSREKFQWWGSGLGLFVVVRYVNFLHTSFVAFGRGWHSVSFTWIEQAKVVAVSSGNHRMTDFINLKYQKQIGKWLDLSIHLGAVHKLCRLKIGNFWPPPPPPLVVFFIK